MPLPFSELSGYLLAKAVRICQDVQLESLLDREQELLSKTGFQLFPEDQYDTVVLLP